MAEYEAQIGGETFTFDAPSDEAAARIIKQIKAQTSDVDFNAGDYARSAVEGGTMGLVGDEAISAMRSMFGAESYEDALSAERDREAAFSAQRPYGDMAAEVAGGLTLGYGAYRASDHLPLPRRLKAPQRLLARALTGATAGATSAAVMGAAEGEDGAMDRAEGAAEMVPWGAGIGAALPLAGYPLGRLVERARSTPIIRAARDFDVTESGARVVGDALERDMPGAFDRIAEAGPYATLAHAGNNTRALLDYAANMPGQGSQAARVNIDGIAEEAAGDLTARMDEVLGAPVGPRTAMREVRQETAGARREAFDEALSAPIDYSSAAGQRVEQIVGALPGRMVQRAIRMANEGDVLSATLDGVARPQQIVAQIEGGAVRFAEMPNMRQLHAMKQALGEIVSSNTDITGKVTGDGLLAQRAVVALRDALVEANPAYREALALGADKIGREQAVTLGNRLLSPRTTREEVAAAVDGMSPEQRRRAAQGVRTQIDEMVANARQALTSDTDATAVIRPMQAMTTGAGRAKLELLLGADEASRLFSTVDEVVQAFRMRAGVAQNSKTAGRQEIRDMLDEAVPRSMGETMVEMGPINSVGALARQIVAAGGPTQPERVREVVNQIALMLSRREIDPAQAVQRLSQVNPAAARAIEARMATQGAVEALRYPAIPAMEGE